MNSQCLCFAVNAFDVPSFAGPAFRPFVGDACVLALNASAAFGTSVSLVGFDWIWCVWGLAGGGATGGRSAALSDGLHFG